MAFGGKSISEQIGTEHSKEPMIPLIEALACDVERVVIVNVLNDKEYVQGVPRDFEVEIPALVSKKGIRGLHTDPLPKAVLSRMMHDRISTVEMELAAFENHDKNLLVDLIMMDPHNRTREQAEGFLEEILNLPYHTEMKEYFSMEYSPE